MARRSTADRTRARARVGGPRGVGVVLAALVSAALVAGCGSGTPAGTPPIPAFPGPGAAPTGSAPPPRDSILPTDCNQVLSAEQMPNLLGMPLGSVTVRSLRDVAAPSVGRLERVTCNYNSNGGPGAPSSGTIVLKLLTSGYTTPQAAVAQAQVNMQVEARSGIAPVPVPLGAAQASYFDDPDGPLLVVVYGRVTTSLTLSPNRPIPSSQAQAVLTDLAQRSLPVLVPITGP